MLLKLPKGVNLAALKKKQASTRGKTAKARGANYEKLIASAIGAWIGLPPSDVFRTRTGSNKEDIGLSAEASISFPFSVECKNQKTIHLPEWIRQSEVAAAKNGLAPIVIFKQWGGKPGDVARNYVVIEFEEFMELVVGGKTT